MKIRNKPVAAVDIGGGNEGVGTGFLSGRQRTSSRTAGGGGQAAATASLWLRPGAAEVHYNLTVSVTPRRKAGTVVTFSY